jgi:hypothetical protein
MAYYNPDGTIEKDKQRTVIVRFKTKEDMIAFSEKTGIKLNQSTKTIKFPVSNVLESLFED